METWRNEKHEVFMHLREPTQYHLWHMKEPGVGDLYHSLEKFKVFVESSHFDRELRRCKACGQLYYYEFYEMNYVIDPNEPIYTTYIPVDNDPVLIDKLNNKSSIELLGVIPRMQSDTGYPWVVWIGRPKQPEDKDFRSRPPAPWEVADNIPVYTETKANSPKKEERMAKITVRDLPKSHPLNKGWIISKPYDLKFAKKSIKSSSPQKDQKKPPQKKGGG